MKTTRPIYFIPGLGTTSTVFERTTVPEGFQKHFIDWIEPLSDAEPIGAYVERLKKQVTHPNPIFAGLSFGGLIALELAQQFRSEKVMLISSFRNKNDLTLPVRALLRTKAYKIIPDIELGAVRRIIRQAYSVRSRVPLAKLLEMMGDHSPRYLRWSVRMIDEYELKLTYHQPELHSIIGDKDRLVQIWKNHPTRIINGGTHIAVYDQAPIVNNILAEILTGNG